MVVVQSENCFVNCLNLKKKKVRDIEEILPI